MSCANLGWGQISYAQDMEFPTWNLLNLNLAVLLKKFKRSFKTSWTKDFTWLKLDVNGNSKVMTCALCIKCGRSNVFTTGKSTSTPKRDDLKKHELTEDHRFAIAANLAVKKEEMPIVVSKAYRKVKDSVTAVMRNVYWLAKEGLPNEKLE